MSAVTKAHTFVDNTVAEASEVNADFDPLYTTLNSGVDSENLAPCGVRANRIGTSAIITRTIADAAVTGPKIDAAAYVALTVEVFG